MEIIPSHKGVSTTVWLYNIASKEKNGDEATGQLQKDVACCFKHEYTTCFSAEA